MNEHAECLELTVGRFLEHKRALGRKYLSEQAELRLLLEVAESGTRRITRIGVRLQPAKMPLLRIESSSAAVLFVLVHHLLEGQMPGVPMPEGLLERARAAGRLAQ